MFDMKKFFPFEKTLHFLPVKEMSDAFFLADP